MSKHGTLSTLRGALFKEKTVSRRIWSMILLLGGIVAVQIMITIVLPKVIFDRDRSVIDPLDPIILSLINI